MHHHLLIISGHTPVTQQHLSRRVTPVPTGPASKQPSPGRGPKHPHARRQLRRGLLFAATNNVHDMALVDTTNAGRSAPTLPALPDAVVSSLRDLVGSSYLNHDSASVQVRAGALFARLKALNRSANAATRTHKQATAETRHDMDQTYLGLQNLLYEKRHLEREIEKCNQFA